MAFITAALVGANLISGAMGARASKKGADAQVQATREATALQREMYEKDLELQEPFRQAGLAGQNRLLELLGLGGDSKAKGYGSAMQPFGMEQFQVEPGYGFRLSEGMKALDRTAAARGGLLSGATLKGAQRFGQNLASDEYMNAFNRYYTQRNAMLNPLEGLAGTGRSTSAELGAAGRQFGQMAGENMIGAGNARASGYVGSANAWANALGGITNTYLDTQYIRRLPKPTGG